MAECPTMILPKWLSIAFLLLVTASCNAAPASETAKETAGPPPTPPPAPLPPAAPASPCQLHIELKDAAFWAKELGRPEIVVLQTHRINLWQNPSPSKGAKVGEMRVGSRAVVLEERDDDYRVRSPLDESTGWVSKIQVERTLMQDINTREPCKP